MRDEKKTWAEVALRLGSHRSKTGVQQHYYNNMKPRQERSLDERKAPGSPLGPSLRPPSVSLPSSIGGRRSYATQAETPSHVTSKPWTQEDLATATRMRQEGRKVADIALKLGRSLYGVEKKFGDLNKSTASSEIKSTHRKFWTQEEVTTLIRMRGEGHQFADIASTLGRTLPSVRNAAIKHSPHATVSGAYTQEDMDTLNRMRREKRTFTEIANVLGRTCRAVESKFYHGPNRRGFLPADDTKILELRTSGMSWYEFLNVTLDTRWTC